MVRSFWNLHKTLRAKQTTIEIFVYICVNSEAPSVSLRVADCSKIYYPPTAKQCKMYVISEFLGTTVTFLATTHFLILQLQDASCTAVNVTENITVPLAVPVAVPLAVLC